MKPKILIVDDEETLCETLRFNLEAEGYDADVAYSSEEALTKDLPSYSLILLDIMMAGISGVQLARIIRSSPATASLPIIFCTAKDTDEDMVEGLNLGADDYIPKPYSIQNVLARVKSVLRRSGTLAASTTESIQYKGLTLIPESKQCLVNGEVLKLARKEFEILFLLLSHKGLVFSREQIISAIWPEQVIVVPRVVDVNITHLRAKLGEYGQKIKTRSGYGYVFET